MPAASQRNRDIGRPLTRSLLAVISDTTRPAPSVAARRRNGASVMPDIGARRTGLASVISPIFKGLRRLLSGPVTSVPFSFWPHHRGGHNTYCAQILGSQASCLHFRQFYQMCKCTAAKTAFPAAFLQLCGIALFLGRRRDKGLCAAATNAPKATLNAPLIE